MSGHLYQAHPVASPVIGRAVRNRVIPLVDYLRDIDSPTCNPINYLIVNSVQITVAWRIQWGISIRFVYIITF